VGRDRGTLAAGKPPSCPARLTATGLFAVSLTLSRMTSFDWTGTKAAPAAVPVGFWK
jgi:hypothetical protein